MAILQFAFGNDPQAPDFKPHNYPRNLVVYTGTHDNDTTVGWWTGAAGHSTRSDREIENERENTRPLSRPRRRGGTLGVHPRRAGVSGRYGNRSSAGPPRPGQRGANESARHGRWQLALASGTGAADPRECANARRDDRDLRPGLTGCGESQTAWEALQRARACGHNSRSKREACHPLQFTERMVGDDHCRRAGKAAAIA